MHIHFKYIGVIILLLLFTLLMQCGDDKSVDIKTVVKTDTVKISHIDTIKFTDTIYRKILVKVAQPIIEIDEKGDSVGTYISNYSDSLIDGEITSKVKGELLTQELSYKPKFPKYIIKTDSIIITKDSTTVINNNTFKLIGGIDIGGNLNVFDVSSVVGFETKKGMIYGYRYGIISNTHNIQISKTFSFKK